MTCMLRLNIIMVVLFAIKIKLNLINYIILSNKYLRRTQPFYFEALVWLMYNMHYA